MHDSTADLPDVKVANQAFAMVQLLVPELKARGYEFVGLEAVPDIAAQAGPVTTVPDVRGAVMLAEIAEQPAMFARIVHDQPAAIREVAAVIARGPPALRPARRPGHQRPRRAVREVPHRDPARPPGRASPPRRR